MAPSGGQLAPFGESRGALLLENLSGDEMTGVVEVVVDRGVG